MSSVSEILNDAKKPGIVNDGHRKVVIGAYCLALIGLPTIELIQFLANGPRLEQYVVILVSAFILQRTITVYRGRSPVQSKRQLAIALGIAHIGLGIWAYRLTPVMTQSMGLVLMSFILLEVSVLAALGRFMPGFVRYCMIACYGIMTLIFASLPTVESFVLLVVGGAYLVVMWLRLSLYLKNFNSVLRAREQTKKSHRELETLQQLIKAEARTDELTQIGNRRAFYDLCRELETGKRKKPLFLALMDLDGLKQINDIHGHDTGDQFIIMAAGRLASAMSGCGQAYRLGGDEFAIIYDDDDTHDLEDFKARLIRLFKPPLKIRTQTFPINWSIGVVEFSDTSEKIEKFTSWADYALYKAKAVKGQSFHMFGPTDMAEMDLDGRLAKQVINILDRGSIKMFGQPILAMQNGAYHIVGIEALLRARDLNGGFIPPDKFVRHAALSGYISKLTEKTLEAAIYMHQLNELECPLYFNLSREQIQDKNLERIVLETVDRMKFQMAQLVIELSEKTLQADLLASTHTLNEFKKLGAKIALDDFGSANTGFSSLVEFRTDIIKTDRSLLCQAMETERSRLVLTKVIELCKELDISCIIEGVETQSELSLVTSLGGQIFQGYYFGMPEEKTHLRPDLLWQDSLVLEKVASKIRSRKKA